MTDIATPVHVLKVSDAGVRVVTFTSTADSDAFWLPRNSHATWVHPLKPDSTNVVLVPDWLASKHRALVGHVEYERAKRERKLRQVRSDYARPIQPKETTTVAYEQKDLTGALFRIPEDKRKSESWPTHEGSVIVGGLKYYLSAWVKEAKSGQKYFSLALKPADEKPAANGKPQAKGAPAADPAIPFLPERR
jgi:hypothetical protein